MQIKKNDFIEIDYIGRIKSTNHVFDLTSIDLAKKEKIYNKEYKYGSKTICVGQNNILKGLDNQLEGKEVGKTYTIEVPLAFGKKDPKMIRVVQTQTLRQQKINPFPGLQINAGGVLGTIRSVSGNRTTVDFNHPLAGRDLVYEITINKLVEDDKKRLDCLLLHALHLPESQYSLEIKEKKATIVLKQKLPQEMKEAFEKTVKELIPALETKIA